MEYRVSVIVPIYRSEPYLERCCRSLFEQTLEEIEYLFILDGKSIEAEDIIRQTVEDCPQRKGDVRIVAHEKNLGISCCRQEGHELATGKYIFHCDSDDWMEREALQLLVETAEAEEADIVFFDYTRHYGVKEVCYRSACVLQGEIPTLDAPLHNKLIRADLIRRNNLRFPEGINWGEDLCMSVLCQIMAEKIAYLPQAFYHRNMHLQSFTSQANKEKYMQLVACPQYIEAELQKRNLTGRFASLLMQMKFEVKEYFLIQQQMRDIKQWKVLYPECHAYIWQLVGVPFYLKFVSYLITHSLGGVADVLLTCRDEINRLRRI